MLRRMSRQCLVLLAVLASGVSLAAQTRESATPAIQVCCRPLPKWSASKDPILLALNKTIVTHLHHCYIDLGNTSLLPGIDASIQSSGIHPIRRDNDDKQPIPDQITDTLVSGGECKRIHDATPEKVERLRDELAGGTCHSCASHYHNRVASFCFNNSNTYVYDLIRGAGMTPPKMHGAPGYRSHHACVGGEKEKP